MESHHRPDRRRNNDDESLKTQNPVAGPLTDVNISSIIANASVASLRLIHIASEQSIHIAGIRSRLGKMQGLTIVRMPPRNERDVKNASGIPALHIIQ